MSQDLPQRGNRQEIFKAHSLGGRILVTRWMETGSQTKDLRVEIVTAGLGLKGRARGAALEPCPGALPWSQGWAHSLSGYTSRHSGCAVPQ